MTNKLRNDTHKPKLKTKHKTYRYRLYEQLPDRVWA